MLRMKKVCILSTVDMSRMTLLSLYTEYLHTNGIEYDIICAKKEAKNTDKYAANIYEFDAAKTQNGNVVQKVLHFWNMRSFADKLFQENDYSFVIVWNQVTAFIFSGILRKRFKNRYCVNIRDYHFDNYPFIRGRIKKALRAAAFNTVSSDGFRVFLPRGDYLMIHSFNERMLSGLRRRNVLRGKDEPIRILNIGQIRWCENIYPLIDELSNDSRFELYFIGTGSEKIDEYISGKSIKNVFTHGRFLPDDTVSFLEKADVIFNLYGVGNLHVDTALSIKLYYAIYLGIPILTYKGTYMNELSTQVGIGYTVEKDSFFGIGDAMFKWYHNLDKKAVDEKCDEFIVKAKKSHFELFDLLDRFLK